MAIRKRCSGVTPWISGAFVLAAAALSSTSSAQASVRDPFGNLFRMIENPHFKGDEVR